MGEAVREREHGDEDRHHQADAERGERGRDRPGEHAAEVVAERDLHSTFLSAVTTGSRAARAAGTMPLASISTSAIPPPSASVDQVTSNPGRNPAALKLVAR